LGKKIPFYLINFLFRASRMHRDNDADARQAIDELQGLERGLLRIGASHDTWDVSHPATMLTSSSAFRR